MTSPSAPHTLQRALDLKDLVAFGVASIMGSGGFNLIAEGVKAGGPLFPAAIGLVAALFQGASKVYDEAYKTFKSNTAEGDVVKQEFGSATSTLTSFSILGFNVFSVSTILVFAAKNIFPQGKWHGQIGLAIAVLALMSGLSLKGIELNKEVIGFFSACIVLLLAFASSIGLVEAFGPSGPGLTAFPAALNSTPSLLKSILYFYFVLSGFDDLIKFVEETKNPDCDIPRSFYLSNSISTLLTIGVAFAFTHVLTMRGGRGQAGGGAGAVPTHNAIGLVVESALGRPSAKIVYWLGIFLMLVTAFVSFLAVSRYLYGLGEQVPHAKEGADPTSSPAPAPTPLQRALLWLQDLNAEKVPWRSVLMTFGLITAGILINHTETLVIVTDFFLTLVMGTVAAAVTKMRWTRGETPWVEGATTLGFLGILSTYIFPME
jgi:amino acid transporter